MILELNRDNFETEVLMSNQPVLVDFWGPQCNPCLALMPVVEKLAATYYEKIKFAKINVANNRMLCARLKVMSLPTFVFYKDGNEINRLSGESISESDLIESIIGIV